MKIWYAAWLILMLSFPAAAEDAFAQANEAFEAGRYQEAVETYEKLLEEGPRVSVLNNLGSAYFRSGDLGRAILVFERALVLDPGDPGLKANLKLAQDQAAVYPSDDSQKRFMRIPGISRTGLAKIALVTSLLLPISALLLLIFRKRAGWTMVVVVLNVALLKIAWQPLKHEVDPSLRGIVVAKSAKVRLSPFEKAENLGELRSGREVKLGQMKDGYYWVDAAGDTTHGWVHEDDVTRVIPAPSNQR